LDTETATHHAEAPAMLSATARVVRLPHLSQILLFLPML
jgi:hypothetical protein